MAAAAGWQVPSVARALGGFGELAPVQGLLFACLMAAISIGGEAFSLSARWCEIMFTLRRDHMHNSPRHVQFAEIDA